MNPEWIGILGILGMFLGLAMGVYIGVTLGVIGFLGCVALIGFHKSILMVTTTPFYSGADYTFIVLPMFMLMGDFAFEGGLGKLLFSAATKWIGRLHGGLAMAATASAALFSAVTGSSLATAAIFGKIAVPEMIRYNYNGRFAAGVVAASGTMAALIPPSGLMVLYCIFTEVSLAKLLIAGIIPGILTAAVYMISIYLRVRINPDLGPRSAEVVPWREKIESIQWFIPILVVALVMLGGLYGGVFTPEEAGGVGAFTVFIVVLLKRSLSRDGMRRAVTGTATSCGMIFFVIIGAMMFGKFLTLSGLPEALLSIATSLKADRHLVLWVVLLMYIVLGTFMDVVAMLAITLPIFFPLLHGLGFDGVWLGILVIKISEIAVITPPVGMNVYVVKGVIGDLVGIGDLFKGIVPFFFTELIILIILVAFPQISLWLPSKMF